jgi:hypothetical protein
MKWLLLLALTHFNTTSLNTCLNYVQLTKLNNVKTKTLGISIYLYSLPKADSIEAFKDLDAELKSIKQKFLCIDQAGEDLAIIFTNESEPFFATNSIPYKMLYGRKCEKESNVVSLIAGFLSTKEVVEVERWIKEKKLETFEGFELMYRKLSDSSLERLKEIGSENTTKLYNSYVEPLVEFYLNARRNNSSVLFVGS